MQTDSEHFKRSDDGTGRYVYRRALPRVLAGLFDRWGPMWLGRSAAQPGVRPGHFEHIAVIRVDQIGDVVLTLPYLVALRRRYPSARITFITTSAGRTLLKNRADLCDVRVFDAPWFKGERGVLQAMRDLSVLLGEVKPDAVADLRGDIRHLWSARRALPNAWIEGYGITGGGFLADYQPVYRPRAHAAARHFELMDVPPPDGPLTIESSLATDPLSRDARTVLPEKMSPWAAFHIGVGAEYKRWPDDSWKRLAERVVRETSAHIIWIGDRKAEDRAQAVLRRMEPSDQLRSSVVGARAGLSELNTLLKQCELLVTHDSGPGHIAAAIHLPTLVLFSAANDPEEWRPLNPRAALLTPLEKMTPDTVFEHVRKALV